MVYENLLLDDHDAYRVITINRPNVLNALNKNTLLELEKAILEIKKNKKIRILIITGAGNKSFVAGADIKEMSSISAIDAQNFSALGHKVFNSLEALEIPVIAAVNGFALGGGLELALAADFIYASSNASFGLVETKLGLIPGFGGCGRLARRIGTAHAKEMIFSASQIDANEALRLGLINKICSENEVILAAQSLANNIAKRGPLAIRLAKRVLLESENASLEMTNLMEQISFGLVFSSKDHEEGINAFLQKRPPQFNGY